MAQRLELGACVSSSDARRCTAGRRRCRRGGRTFGAVLRTPAIRSSSAGVHEGGGARLAFNDLRVHTPVRVTGDRDLVAVRLDRTQGGGYVGRGDDVGLDEPVLDDEVGGGCRSRRGGAAASPRTRSACDEPPVAILGQGDLGPHAVRDDMSFTRSRTSSSSNCDSFST